MLENNIPVDEIDIDTLVSMIKMAYAFDNWKQVISLSDDLLEKSTPDNKKILMKKPLVYYFGYSHLMKGLALQKLKIYKESMACVHIYSDLNWIDNSQEGKYYIDSFQTFAKANLLTLELLMGVSDKLPEYLDILIKNPDEALPGLITIIESALVHNFDVDKEISQLIPYISEYNHQNRPVRIAYYLTAHYLLALYYYKKRKYSNAIVFTLHNITESDKLSNDRYFKRSIALFDVLKAHASVPQMTEYSDKLHSILRRAIENEENFDFDSVIRFN
ncbi:MAG: hypothetical protein ACQEXX_01190 [Bacillota bacterium]